MSYTQPQSYISATAPQLGVPSMLASDNLLHFRGARSSIKYIPASTGSSIGPSSSVLFQIPGSGFGFIKPNSMYLRCKVTVTQPGNGDANSNTSGWAFAGQNGFETVDETWIYGNGSGGASSLINRLTVTFPGGIQMSYPNYSHFRNAIIPHALTYDFLTQDLRELEHAGMFHKNRANGTALSTTAYVVIPIDLPCFNAHQAFPLCLMSSGITIELVTETVGAALYANKIGATAVAQAISSFALSEMALVYEELAVSPEFKSALVAATAERPFSIAVADRLFLGNVPASSSSRTNIGVGLSSLKSVVGSFQLNSATQSTTNQKRYTYNGLRRWDLFINGSQVTPSNLNNDAVCFAEFTRAIQTYNDPLMTSYLPLVVNTPETSGRNTYTSGQFAFGCSTAVYSDAAFALSGIPADQIQVDFEFGADADQVNKWQIPVAAPDPATAYLWALHDAVLTILPDGTVSMRK